MAGGRQQRDERAQQLTHSPASMPSCDSRTADLSVRSMSLWSPCRASRLLLFKPRLLSPSLSPPSDVRTWSWCMCSVHVKPLLSRTNESARSSLNHCLDGLTSYCDPPPRCLRSWLSLAITAHQHSTPLLSTTPAFKHFANQFHLY